MGYGVGNCTLDPAFVAMVGCSSGNDAITVARSNHIWFDHDDVSDGTDGNLDITLGSDFVTVSWTKFHYTARTDNTGNDSTGASGHRYSNLVGGDDNSSPDIGKLNVTWHHNWWADRVVERQPRIRYGKNHLYNNLWTSSGENYCVRSGMNAQILLESNVFMGVKSLHEFNKTADQGTSNITSTNNVYSGTRVRRPPAAAARASTTPVVRVCARRRLVGPGPRPGGRRPHRGVLARIAAAPAIQATLVGRPWSMSMLAWKAGEAERENTESFGASEFLAGWR